MKLSPLGGESSPYLAPAFWALSSIDQQWMELSSFMPQMWPSPTLMAVRTGTPQAASPASMTTEWPSGRGYVWVGYGPCAALSPLVVACGDSFQSIGRYPAYQGMYFGAVLWAFGKILPGGLAWDLTDRGSCLSIAGGPVVLSRLEPGGSGPLLLVRFRRSVPLSPSMGDNDRAIVRLLTQSLEMISTNDIQEHLSLDTSMSTLRRVLNRLESMGVVVSESRGLHKFWGMRRRGEQ